MEKYFARKGDNSFHGQENRKYIVCGAGQSGACQISGYLKFVLKRTLKAWQACIYKGDSGFYVGAKLSFDKIKLSKFCESNQM